METDQELLDYWQKRLLDAELAVEVAKREVAYFSRLVMRSTVEAPDEA